MKKGVVFLFALIFMLLQFNLMVFAENIPIGTDIGDVLATDIVAKINNFTIPSFNINNSMAIYAKHLNNYGFDVVWNAEKRQVDIVSNLNKKFDPIPTETGTAAPIGTKLGDVLHTDIKTFINGKEIQSFNINGSTAVYFRDLREFGTVVWDGVNRVSSLTTDHAEYRSNDKMYEPSEVSKIASPAVVYIEIYNKLGKAMGSGSGFIIDNSGLVVTNYHVIDGAHKAVVKLVDGRVFDVKNVLQSNKARDIAILKIDGKDLPIVLLGDSDKVDNGEKILTIGSPIGLENTISDGLISNKNRVLDKQRYFQISAPISPGSSGGALLNLKAEVIGITTAIFVEGQNLNLAIPINEVKSYITAALNSSSTQPAADGSITNSGDNSGYQVIEYDDGEKYVGEMQNGLYNGWGTYYWSDGIVYEGEWVDGERNGYGVMTWTDGDKYEGNFEDGYRHGFGTYIWSDGDKYEGMWYYGDMHGKATYTYSDGTQVTGIWSYNDYIGENVNAPTGVWATGVASDEIWVFWDAMNEADYFHVYYSYTASGPFICIDDDDGSKSKFYPDDYYDASIVNIKSNTKVYFKITAVVGGEESDFSEITSATTKR